MNDPSLEARNVSCRFGPLTAVDNVSLSIGAGQVVALLGKSGSGKSTLLRLFAGLESLDSGEIYAGGERVSWPQHAKPPEQRGLGMVFQDFALFPHLTALANVMFGLQSLGKVAGQKVALEWLSKVGLHDRATYFPHQLSGGEQQRVALARALAPQPKAVLMDEPFSGLDPHLRADLQRTMLSTLREAGVSALIVSHDTEEALGIADQVAIMDHGKIIQTGIPTDVFTAPVSLEAARALGSVWAVAGVANESVCKTPFGTFPTHLMGPVVVAARPDWTHFLANVDGAFVVSDVRGVGRFVTVTLQNGASLVQVRLEAHLAPQIGSHGDVNVQATHVFIFKAAS